MPESPSLEARPVDCDTIVKLADGFIEAIGDLSIVEDTSLEEIGRAVELIGRRVCDECCADKLRGHAILANQILTIVTTRMA